MQHYQHCKIRCVEYFGALYRASAATIPQLLTERIGAAQTDRQRNRYLDAREAFEAVTAALLERYERALAQQFDEFAANPELAMSSPATAGKLSLVDKAQYEDDVAVRSIAAKSAALNSEELWKLNRRFALLRGGRKFPGELNPCGPLRLCVAVQEAYRCLDVDAMVKLYLYKLYEQDVLSRAGDFYLEINAELAGQGILANLGFDLVQDSRAAGAGAGATQTTRVPPPRASRAVSAGTAEPNSDPQAPARAAANDAPDESVAPARDQESSLLPQVTAEVERRQTRVMDAIRVVQQKRVQSGQTRTSTAGGAAYGSLSSDGVQGEEDTFTAGEITAALGLLQTELKLPSVSLLEPGQVGEIEGKLLSELTKQGAGTARQKVAALDADTSALVGMLCDYMLDDPKLPDSLKSLLSHLHTPYLKVALLDPAFFSSAAHPARRLLDLLAAAGARWLQEGEDDEKIHQRIRHVVERVLGEFKEDISFFDALLGDFVRFTKLMEKRADLAEKRSMEAQKGLDKLSQAKAVAAREVERRLQQTGLSELVRSLLIGPWSDYLVYLYLRHGGDGEAWHSALAVVDGVVESTRPQRPGGKSFSLEEQAGVCESVASGLGLIGCDQQRSDTYLKALASAHELARKGETPAAEEPAVATVMVEHRDSAIARQLKQQLQCESGREDLNVSELPQREQALARQLLSLEFGTWFEFSGDGRVKWQRLKLSWYSSVSGNYMFVNASGVKIDVKTLRSLVRGMMNGTVLILERDTKNLFERAVTSMLLRLRKS